MFQNYLTTALRNILKHKLYSFINVIGLAIGLAACILIMLFVRDELSYDNFITNADNIYRLEAAFAPPGRSPIHTSHFSGRAKFGLQDEFPEIQNLTRFMYDFSVSPGGTLVKRGENIFIEKLMFADPNILSFFDLPVVSGNRDTALADNSSVVISERIANKYFGSEDPLGQNMTLTVLGEEREFKISSIIRDLPQNSHLEFDMAIKLVDNQFAFDPNFSERWMASNMYVYFNLGEGVKKESIETRFPDFIDRVATPEIREFGMTLASANLMATWNIINLKDIHIYGAPMMSIKPGGSLSNIISFSAIAIIILVIAIINFTNLSTARSAQRAKEVSMRKVLGAKRSQVIFQFLGEANLMSFLAVGFALAFVEIILPSYNSFLGKSLNLGLFDNIQTIILFLGVSVIVGTISGLYPSFQLSSPRPALVLKANKSASSGSVFFRNLLVVVQFSASIALFIATATVYNQTNFARSLDTGYKTDGIMLIKGLNEASVAPSALTFKREINSHPDVLFSSISLRAPGETIFGATRSNLPGSTDRVVMTMQPVDFDFFKTYEVEPIAGRLLSEEFGSDVIRTIDSDYRDGGVVLNETAVRRFGFATPQSAIGKEFQVLADTSDTSKVITATIVGVIPDLLINSVRDAINPSFYFVDARRFTQLSISFETENLGELLAFVENTWKKIAPDFPFRVELLDENLAALYENEEATSQMFAIFAGLAIFVSSLGLYGLAAFAAEKRTREIGIRKVLGAKVRDIIQLLVWQFSKPVIVANIIAWPIAWYFMSDWLNGFTQRITLSPFLFLGAGVVALMIAWGTVASRAAQVARTNPIHALRYE